MSATPTKLHGGHHLPHGLNPAKHPLPSAGKHPLRHAIEGEKHLVKELIASIQAKDIHAGLKQWLCDELGQIETNAAELDFHLVDHAHGGMSLQAHLKPVHLGAKLPPEKPAHTAAPAVG